MSEQEKQQRQEVPYAVVKASAARSAILRGSAELLTWRARVSIRFIWLSASDRGEFTGWEQTVRLPYDTLAEFAARSLVDGESKQWKALSLAERRTPKLVFCSKENLHAAVSNKIVRSKLVRCLRDHFDWLSTDEIRIFNDFLPYSFFFQAYRAGCPGICGGLILHDHQDLGRAYYSMHT